MSRDMIPSLSLLLIWMLAEAVSFAINTRSAPDVVRDQTYVLRRNRLFFRLGVVVVLLGLFLGVVAELNPDLLHVGVGILVLIFGLCMILPSPLTPEVRWNDKGIVGPDFGTPAGLVMRDIKFQDVVEFKKRGWRFWLYGQECYCIVDGDGHRIFWGYRLKGYTALNDEVVRLRPDLV